MKIPMHIYECGECILVFAVEQTFEDQTEICCPNCGNDGIKDVSSGILTFDERVLKDGLEESDESTALEHHSS